MSSVGKVLGQLAIVLVHTRTVLKTKYKTQFFKDSPVSIVLHPKAIVLNCTRGDIQRMSSIGPRLHSRWRGQLPSTRTVLDMGALRFSGSWCSRSSKSSNGPARMPARSPLRCPLGFPWGVAYCRRHGRKIKVARQGCTGRWSSCWPCFTRCIHAL